MERDYGSNVILYTAVAPGGSYSAVYGNMFDILDSTGAIIHDHMPHRISSVNNLRFTGDGNFLVYRDAEFLNPNWQYHLVTLEMGTWNSWSVTIPDTVNQLIAVPGTGDFIVALNDVCQLRRYHKNTLVQSYANGPDTYPWRMAAHSDGSVIVSLLNGEVHCWNGNGTKRWGVSLAATGMDCRSATISSDGAKFAVISKNPNKIHIGSMSDGSVLYGLDDGVLMGDIRFLSDNTRLAVAGNRTVSVYGPAGASALQKMFEVALQPGSEWYPSATLTSDVKGVLVSYGASGHPYGVEYWDIATDVIDGAAPNTGTYEWTPQTAWDHGRIVLQENARPEYYAYSPVLDFADPGDLIITISPQDPQVLPGATQQFTATVVDSLSGIDYTHCGVNWYTSTSPSNYQTGSIDGAGLYTATRPGTNRVIASSALEPGYAYSATYVQVASQLTLNVPNGGETWKITATETAEWTSAGIVGDIGLALWRDEVVRSVAQNGTALDFAHDSGNGWLVGTVQDGDFVMTDIADGSVFQVIDIGAAEPVYADNNGMWLAIAGDDNRIYIYSMADYTLANILGPLSGSIYNVAMCGPGDRLLAADASHNVTLWNVQTSTTAPEDVLSGGGFDFTPYVAMSPDGSYGVIGTWYGLCLIHLEGNSIVLDDYFSEFPTGSMKTAVAADTHYAYASGSDVWVYEKAASIGSPAAYFDTLGTGIGIGIHGGYVVTAGSAGFVEYWRLENAFNVKPWPGNPSNRPLFTRDMSKPLSRMRCSDDGMFLALNDGAGAADVWQGLFDFAPGGTADDGSHGWTVNHVLPSGKYKAVVYDREYSGHTRDWSDAYFTVGAAPVPQALLIVPDSRSVELDASCTFQAVVHDQYGDRIFGADVSWSVSGGGTINSSGVFTANAVGGPFTVTATAGAASDTAEVTVTEKKPIARISAAPAYSIAAPVTVVFDAGASTSPGGRPMSFSWDFDYTGAFVADEHTGAVPTASHEYTAPGTYIAAVLVDDGEMAIATVQVFVGDGTDTVPPDVAVSRVELSGTVEDDMHTPASLSVGGTLVAVTGTNPGTWSAEMDIMLPAAITVSAQDASGNLAECVIGLTD